MFEQTFRNIDDVLWKEAGCTTELDYTEQTSWMLFLKYLDDLEQERGIKNTFLSNSDNAAKALRQELLESCSLYAVLDCPGGTFLGAGVKTVVLFFEKGTPTRKTWYYQFEAGL